MRTFTKKVYLYVLVFVLFCFFFCWLKKEIILLNLGEFLFVEEDFPRADVIVLLRGDKNYSRALEAARLYKEGYSSFIYISLALDDKNIDILKNFGVRILSEQERLKAILVQSGVQERNILCDLREPGGGTMGEIKRVKAMMLVHGFVNAIIVTNWWHTKRTKKICEKIFSGKNHDVFVAAARSDKTTPSNWWQYRYEAINIIEEIPKLIIFKLFPSSYIKFEDDPKLIDRE